MSPAFVAGNHSYDGAQALMMAPTTTPSRAGSSLRSLMETSF